MKSNYPKAIQYLTAIQREGINAALTVLGEIAKHHPGIVVQAFESCFTQVNTKEKQWEEAIIGVVRNHSNPTDFQCKIECIKLYRGLANCGLKEAKDAVEAIFKQHNIPESSRH